MLSETGLSLGEDVNTPVTNSPEAKVANLTGYKFVKLPDRDALRQPFRDKCNELDLKGLILLAHEGINFFVAGAREATLDFKAFLETDDRFQNIPVKLSFSRAPPFKRMLVKLKREIIALGVDKVDPENRTGKRIMPMELKQWLDEKKEVILLDTRNDYEIRIGAFKGALDPEMQSFTEFPEVVSRLRQDRPEALDVPVVTYCTGGVRCEKATAVMMDHGFKDVYQLDGGVLRYFEQCGGEHWDGDCFVFDDRVAVNPRLEETSTKMCFNCREPLTVEDQASPLYVVGESCPYCETKKRKRFHTNNPGSGDASSEEKTREEKHDGLAADSESLEAAFLPFGKLVDAAKERQRLSKQETKIVKEVARLEKRLGCEGFLKKASPEIIQGNVEALAEKKERLSAIEASLSELKG